MNGRFAHIAIAATALAVVCAVGVVRGADEKADAKLDTALDPRGVEFFESKVRPVLVKHCYECHSEEAKKVKGNLRLDIRAGWQQGGDIGPAIVPGDAEASLLIKAVGYGDPDMEMPPKGKLPEHVIADLTKWVEMGAPDPRDGELKVQRGREIDWDEARDFWAFRKPVKRDPPAVNDTAWPRTDIDRYILARLEKDNLRPVADADRRTLLRRVYYDLIGLPPTPQQIDAFMADKSDDALVKVVDELLSSPHFGERWGRHWLDVARFAEASGGGRELIYKNAWRYRDYVIDSFNADKPYDVFVREQIAGDLMPHRNDDEREQRITATGYLMLGPTNYELQDKELLRMEVIDEQIDVLGRTFMAMTIGCARCHTHPFDPIPHEDYYALVGILRSTKVLTPGNVSGYVERELPTDPAHRAELERHAAAVKALEDEIKAAKSDLKNLGGDPSPKDEPPAGIDPSTLPGIVMDDADAALSGGWTDSTSIKPYAGGGYSYARGGATARYTLKLPEGGRYEVRVVYAPHPNRATNTSIEIHHADGVAKKTVNQRTGLPIDGTFESLGVYRFDKAKPAVVVISGEGADGTVIADLVQLLPEGAPAKAKPDAVAKNNDAPKPAAKKNDKQALAKQRKQIEQHIAKLEGELKSLKKDAPEPAPKAMAVRDEEPKEIGDYHLCIRGDVHTLGPKVPRGFLTVITPGPARIADGASGRMELADWIASPDHPLTARVMVNRIWHHLFGHGLVRTTDNFGVMGELPSHPELLDHLALTFVDNGWSVKRMIRRIVLSRVYQLSSSATVAEARSVDPENRLLWRADRRRLDAESIRDTMLLAAGQLDLTAGGMTMRANTGSSFGYRFDVDRRSVYIPVFRNTLHELMEVFDFADPNLVIGARPTSTRPTQALYMMNSPNVMDRSRAAAERLLAETGIDDAARVELAYLRMLSRPPSEAEHAIAQRFIDARIRESKDNDARLDAWAAFCQAMFASVDFRYLN